MANDPNAPLRAAVLATTLSFEPKPVDPFELRVSAIRRVMPRITPPLTLDAPIYRYFCHSGGDVTMLGDRVGARACSTSHRRRRN